MRPMGFAAIGPGVVRAVGAAAVGARSLRDEGVAPGIGAVSRSATVCSVGGIRTASLPPRAMIVPVAAGFAGETLVAEDEADGQ